MVVITGKKEPPRAPCGVVAEAVLTRILVTRGAARNKQGRLPLFRSADNKNVNPLKTMTYRIFIIQTPV